MAHRIFGSLTTLVLIAFPALLLLVPSGGSAPYHVLALAALIALALRRPISPRPPAREEKLAFLGYALFTLTILISLAHTGFSREAVKELDVLLRPMWAIPIIYLFIRTRPPEALLWFGVSICAAAAGLNAIYEVATAEGYIRPDGANSAVTYGNTALLTGFIAAIGMPYFRRLGRAYLLVPAAALLLGLIASFLSGSRGGWIALPALVLLLMYHYWQPRYRGLAVAGALALAALTALAVLLPQTGVTGRIQEAVTEVERYMENPAAHGDTSVGQRFELWRAGLDMLKEKPVLGDGLGKGYHRFLLKGIAAGEYHPAVAVQTFPHNVFLAVTVQRGLVGLAGLLALWGTLAYVFVAAARERTMEIRALGNAGLTLIGAYLLFGLTDSVMDYGPPLVFFCLYSALIVHLIARARLAGRAP